MGGKGKKNANQKGKPVANSEGEEKKKWSKVGE